MPDYKDIVNESCFCKTINKKHSFDCNILNNNRPVSNLAFLSNVIKMAVALHLTKCLVNNYLNESLQSTYTSGHSTETALVPVKIIL